LHAIDFEFATGADVVQGRSAGGAGILQADDGTVFALAGVAKGDQRRFLNDQLRPVEEGALGLHVKGELQASGFDAGELADGEEYFFHGRAIGLGLPPFAEGDDESLGHVGFVHGFGRSVRWVG